MIVIVAGGTNQRLAEPYGRLYWLASLAERLPITEIISGCAVGIDSDGDAWASARGLPVWRFPPEYDKYSGEVAPKARNVRMAQFAQKHGGGLIAFAGNSGTAHMIETAWKFGLPMWLHQGAPISRDLKREFIKRGIDWTGSETIIPSR